MIVNVIHSALEETPRLVAKVDAGSRSIDDALEYAYNVTNNLRGSWSQAAEFTYDKVLVKNLDYNPNVSVLVDLPVRLGKTYGLRSTSMGDQMLVDSKKYKVDMAGFKEI